MPPTATAFKPLEIPIQGTNLIEASAGTGKTYGIAALFTRMILLEKIPVERILVVTFTQAASAELKNRLRARLDEALRWLVCEDSRRPAIDGFLQNLLDKALQEDAPDHLALRLRAAISQFDNAAVYTIHGFCQRLLRDYAFLCQVPFDMELDTQDNKSRLLIPAQDFWRNHIAHNTEAARLVFKHKLTPKLMLEQMGAFVNRPFLTYPQLHADMAEKETELQALWHQIAAALPRLEQIFWQIYPALNGKIYNQNKFKELFTSLNQDAVNQSLSENQKLYETHLPKLAAEPLNNNIKKGKTLDASHTELSLLAGLWPAIKAKQQAEQAALSALQIDFLHYLNHSLNEQKKTQRERSFDDLMLDVYTALTESPHREELADLVAETWQAALIDEFQDTDPLQYEIFRRTFIRRGKPLFLVGDPKQAIYGFRGADIHAYLKAAADADRHYTLTRNHRSHHTLIKSIGWFFRQKQHPFVLNGIGYPDVSAARSHACLKPAPHALRIRWLNGEDEAGLDKTVLRKRAAEYCADEIAAMLNRAGSGGLDYQNRPLQSGDIAVLVRTRHEGSLIGASLKNRGIQSVLLQRTSVFASQEAPALAALLAFWLRPQDTPNLRFALGSILFRYTADALHALNNNETALLDYINAAQNAADTWRKHGIYSAMQAFSARYGLETGLLAARNERSLTNYHQIIELLAEENEKNRSPESLHQWLLAQINEAGSEKQTGDDQTLRLESDEALISIVTMHGAKGLQYPVVFCPFVWDAKDGKSHPWRIVHRDGSRSELLPDYMLDDDDRRVLADEELGESLRLLYVAMTRAEEQLTVYAAHCSNSSRNTFAYLLEGGMPATREDVERAYTAEKQANKADGEQQMLLANWQRFLSQAPQDTDFEWLTGAPPHTAGLDSSTIPMPYQALTLPDRKFEFIRHTSFTGLLRDTATTHRAERDELLPAIDAAEAGLTRDILYSGLSENPEFPDKNSIHAFPKGTHAGICLHELLENFDFNRPASSQSGQIETTLTRYGFDSAWLPPICGLLDNTANTPLFNRIALAALPPRNRLAEMDFMLKVADFSPEKLRTWFCRPGLNLPPECIFAAKQLDFETVKGFLNGFIDMICFDDKGNVCLIDYKSNYLGSSSEAYTAQAMNEAMAAHHYYLQALIYAVAAVRYLQLQDTAVETVYVRYLFLRGLGKGNNGIWEWQLKPADLMPWL